MLHHDFILHFSCVVGVVWSILAFLARNLNHKKEGRGEGRKDNFFSSSDSPGNVDATGFADLDLSMSTTNKLLWVFQGKSNKQVIFVWNYNVFFLFCSFFSSTDLPTNDNFKIFFNDSKLQG